MSDERRVSLPKAVDVRYSSEILKQRLGGAFRLIPEQELQALLEQADSLMTPAKANALRRLFAGLTEHPTNVGRILPKLAQTDPAAATVTLSAMFAMIDRRPPEESISPTIPLLRRDIYLPMLAIMKEVRPTRHETELDPTGFPRTYVNQDHSFKGSRHSQDTVLCPGASAPTATFEETLRELEETQRFQGLKLLIEDHLKTLHLDLNEKYRANNNIFGVFDGAGTPNGSQIASRLAAHVLQNRAQAWSGQSLEEVQPQLEATLVQLHTFIVRLGMTVSQEYQRRHPENHATHALMGTTACTGQLGKTQDGREAFLLGAVGDSEAFHWDEKRGVATRISPDNNDFIGYGPTGLKTQPATRIIPLQPGDKILLMSDGINKYLDPVDVAVNIVLARWNKQTVPERIISKKTILEKYDLTGKAYNSDDKSMVEISCRPDDQELTKRREQLVLKHNERLASGGINPTIVKRWRAIIDMNPETRTEVFWQLLKLLYGLKMSSYEPLVSIVRYADTNPSTLGKAFMLLEDLSERKQLPATEEDLVRRRLTAAQRVINGTT